MLVTVAGQALEISLGKTLGISATETPLVYGLPEHLLSFWSHSIGESVISRGFCTPLCR